MMSHIFFVVRSLKLGGAERVLCEVAEYLHKKEYEVTIITFAVDEQEYSVASGIERVNLNIPETGWRKLFVGRKRLHTYLKEQNACICISFDILANILLILSAPAKCLRVISERNAPRQTNLSKSSKILRKMTYWRCDRCVFQTEGARDCYSKRIRNRGIIIPNPVKDNLPYRTGVKKEIVAIGRLEKQKNYCAMINGVISFLDQFPEYTFRIYGAGSQYHNLKKQIVAKGMDAKIRIEPPTTDIHHKITDAEIFIITSDYEGIPNVLLEAMAMGFPVVAYDCPPGGCSLLVQNEENGILIDSQDEATIARALEKYACDDVFREDMGKNATEVRDRFSLGVIGEKWISLLNELEEEIK